MSSLFRSNTAVKQKHWADSPVFRYEVKDLLKELAINSASRYFRKLLSIPMTDKVDHQIQDPDLVQRLEYCANKGVIDWNHDVYLL